jgi:pimeloyl-ACP methyl ester carboxylesterase
VSEPEPCELAGFPGLHAAPAPTTHGPLLLCIHGSNQDHQHFANYLRYFSDRGFDCYAFPRRGRSGVPPSGAQGVTFAEYLSDTVRVLDALGRPAIVVGHSLGGLIAQKVAESGRCRAAVLLAPLAPRQIFARLIPPLPAIPVYLKIMPAVVTGASFGVTYPDMRAASLNHVPESRRQSIFLTLMPESGVAARDVLIGIPVDAAKVTCPVLCVIGGDDRFVSKGVVRSIARLYHADFRESPAHGHLMMEDDNWEEIPKAILSWFEAKRLVGTLEAQRS